ncbi:isoaspartyl peptidase/L-asparaginase [Ectothiorhodospiraceae bacterium 2226]|nr:isoaspartyl peptidase/L-asparaginase [Ectothiorhodospiraceae bacterium 2226]
MPAISPLPSLIVHGGAGRCPADEWEARQEGCRAAAEAGWDVLARGGSALEAAEAAVVVLEDDPQFNAGTGSVLTRDGEVELDACLMDSEGLRAGAIGGVRGVKNAIRLARAILEDGRHVLLVGEGARRFAEAHQVALCDPSELVVARQAQRHEEARGQEGGDGEVNDTVGCVACDAAGRFAAATSTGGRFGQLPGRVGDSALVGAGNYADEAGGVSCTGIGEAIIRTVMAKSALDLTRFGLDAMAAAREAVGLLEARTRSEAGLILIDRHGHVGYAHNCDHMPVCYIQAGGATVTDI